MQQNRRAFLKQIGLGTLAVTALPSLWHCASPTPSGQVNQQDFGLQLYTLRDILQGQVENVLQKVGAMGYAHIETYGVEPGDKEGQFLGIPLSIFQENLNKAGLRTYSGHYNLEAYLNPSLQDQQQLQFALDSAAFLGQEYVIAPVPPIHLVNELGPDEYRFMAQQLNEAGKKAQDKGIKMGYHNHFWEFRTLADGQKGIDILLENTDPNLVVFEMDLFWTERAGFSNLDYFARYPGRFPLWHIKDMDPNFQEPMLGASLDTLPLETLNERIRYTEVGTGTIDFKAIWQDRNQAGGKYFYVEQDFIYKDPLESIQESLTYIQKELKA
jgi:sugar phosphate isomerase/epimerase